MPKFQPWTLADARGLVEALVPPLAQVGYCVGITGSVLFKGFSAKDLDLIVYPLHGLILNITKAKEALRSVGMAKSLDHTQIKHIRARAGAGAPDPKVVEMWVLWGKGASTKTARRIDVFWLS